MRRKLKNKAMIGFPKNFTDLSGYVRHKQSCFPFTKEMGRILARQAGFVEKKGRPDRKTEGWRHFPFQKTEKANFAFSDGMAPADLSEKSKSRPVPPAPLSGKARPVQPSTLSDGKKHLSQPAPLSEKGVRSTPPPAPSGNRASPSPSLVFPDSIALKIQNGCFDLPADLPPGLSVFKWKDALKGAPLPEDVQNFIFTALKKEREGLCPLNSALSFGGLVIVVDRPIEKPLEIQYLYPPGRHENPAENLRNFIFLRDGASAQVAEIFYGTGLSSGTSSVLFNLQTDCFIGAGAQGDFIRLDQGGERDIWLNHLFCEMAQEAEGRFFTLSLSCGVSRQVTRLFQRKRSVSDMRGLSLLSGGRHAEHKVTTSHLEEEGLSRQLYQSLLFQKAKHVFSGRIHIERPAQKTSARQLSRNLILGERASAVSAPELDIKADDVKAHHGAVVSPFEESRSLLFYLQSRGIDTPQALNLILTSLMKETFSALPPRAKTALENLTQSHLQNIKGSSALSSAPLD